MNILFNSSINIVGGGVKNAAIFIKHAIKDDSIHWHFIISPQVKNVLVGWAINTVVCM